MTKAATLLLIAVSVAAPACSDSTDDGAKSSGAVVDLSQFIETDIPTFPGGVGLQMRVLASLGRDGYDANAFAMGEHTGTHVDAPSHFAAGRATVENIPVEQLVGVGAVIDVSSKVARRPDYEVSKRDIEAWESEHGELGPEHIVLVRTGWEKRWPDTEAYQNMDAEGVMRFPGVSVEATRHLIVRGVRGLGIDTLSTDVGSSADFAQHRLFLGNGGWHIENLRNLDRLPAVGATVVVAPLPIVGGSGAPARVLAILP